MSKNNNTTKVTVPLITEESAYDSMFAQFTKKDNDVVEKAISSPETGRPQQYVSKDLSEFLETLSDLPLSGEVLLDRSLLDPAPPEWNGFPVPTAEILEEMAKSISNQGLFNPITVWEQENGRYMILSGHTRNFVFEKLYEKTKDKKWLKIPAKCYAHEAINEYDAQRVVIMSNCAQRAQESPAVRAFAMGKLAMLYKKEAAKLPGRIKYMDNVGAIFGTKHTDTYFYTRLGQKLIYPFLEMFAANKIGRIVADRISIMPEETQEYLLSKEEYVKRLSPDIANLFAPFMNKQELDRLFSARHEKQYHYRFDSLYQRPNAKDMATSVTGFIIPDDDVEKFYGIVHNAIESTKELSPRTKEMLLKQIRLTRNKGPLPCK